MTGHPETGMARPEASRSGENAFYAIVEMAPSQAGHKVPVA